MRRLKFTVEYDGTHFHGWQRQPNLSTVQGEIEAALLKITGETIQLAAAGRTDKGVHAWGQITHGDIASDKPLIKFLDGINHHTSSAIAITKVEEVAEDFHARFSATARSYRYLLHHRRQLRPDLVGRAGHCRTPLNIAAMQAAIQNFPLGEIDCETFRSSECQSNTSMVRLDKFSLTEQEDHLLAMDITANHFLHNMVRILMGTLVEIGQGKRPPASLATLLNAKDRTQAGPTFMPDGLYLTHVTYPEHKVIDCCGD